MYGDILNLDGWAGRGMSVELLKEKVDILHAHCEAVGRDPAEIVRTVGVGVQDLNGNLDKYAAAGATQFIFSRTVPWDYAPLEQFIRWRDR